MALVSLVWSGVFSTGYSQEFATLMRECCQSLMAKFSAACRLDTGSCDVLCVSRRQVYSGKGLDGIGFLLWFIL